jgi:hypothetical protein
MSNVNLLETVDTIYCGAILATNILTEIMGNEIANTISGVTLTKQEISSMFISDLIKQANLNKKG